MEMLNSFWELLTTENELMAKIITSPTVIIELWIAFFLNTCILKFDYTNAQKWLYIIVLSISSLISEFIIPTPFNVIINYLFMFIFIKATFKQNILGTILCVIIPTFVFALVGNLILNPLLKLINITYRQTECIPIYRMIYLVTAYILSFIVVKLLNLKNIKFSFINQLNSNNRKIIFFNLVFGIFTLSIQLIITFYYINTYSLIFTLLNFISLLAYFSISLYSLTRTMKLQITSQNLENAENYNNTLSYLYDNVRAFHHDFDNMLFIIGGFIDNNDIDGLKKYYKSLEKDGERVNNIALLNPKLINNSGIYNLLMSKYKKAHENNVEIKLDYFFDLEKLHMPIYEFSRILGILLDNSIESAAETNEKQVNILFRDSTANSTQIICIENTCQSTSIDKKKIFEKGETSKLNHSGMGLWEVNQIIKRINNITLNTEIENGCFKQTLEIYY